jgi:hypothetical protein
MAKTLEQIKGMHLKPGERIEVTRADVRSFLTDVSMGYFHNMDKANFNFYKDSKEFATGSKIYSNERKVRLSDIKEVNRVMLAPLAPKYKE